MTIPLTRREFLKIGAIVGTEVLGIGALSLSRALFGFGPKASARELEDGGKPIRIKELLPVLQPYALIFASAMEEAGISITQQQIENPLSYSLKVLPNNSTVVCMIVDNGEEIVDHPLIVGDERGQWREASPGKLIESVGGVYILGTSINFLREGWPKFDVYSKIAPLFSGFLPDWDFQRVHGKDLAQFDLEPTQGNYNFKYLDLIYILSRQGYFIIGQPLLPQLPDYLPLWLQGLRNKPNELEAAGFADIETLMHKYPNITFWTLLGELDHPHFSNIWAGTFGAEDALIRFGKKAHAVNQKAVLGYSNFDIEFGGDKSDNNFNTLISANAKGAGIGCMIFQGHLRGENFVDPKERHQRCEALAQEIERYRRSNIAVAVLEMDVIQSQIPGREEQKQHMAYQTRFDVVSTLIANGVQMIGEQGGTDKESWKADDGGTGMGKPTPFHDDGSRKAAYYGLTAGILNGIYNIPIGLKPLLNLR